MADLDIYEHQPTEAWYLHDPITGTEVVITPNADREAVEKAVEQGASIIHQTADGQRELATIDQLPEPEEPEAFTIVAPEYVDARVRLLEAALNLITTALQGFVPEGRFQALKSGLERAHEAVETGNPEQIETVAADLGIAEGPSME